MLEIYFTREIESSQAQTELNLARFFIQAGIILLWCPVVHTVILDIKAVPADEYIWASFLSRLKQRLFIKAETGSTRTIRTPPTMPITAMNNRVTGSGSEQSTTRNLTARWGDSQGLLHSRDRLSIPNLAIGLGYSAAGAVLNGFIGTLATMLSPHTPGRGSIPLIDYPFRIPLVHDYPTGELDFLTSLDILIPRPSWGHEEAEGFTLGRIIRRLTRLKRLSVHADGVIQHNSGNYGEFGLMRKPPFSTTDTGDDDSDDAADADMIVAEDGTVAYPSTSGLRTTSSQSGQISIIASNATNTYGGYGPETWWAGLFNALTIGQTHPDSNGGLEPLNEQSIQELRISVSIPGGYVQLADFDAFFSMVVSYLQRMSTLEVLIFDMLVDLQSESNSYYNWSRNGPRAMRDHFERQRAYVTRLIDPDALVIPLVSPPDKPEMTHHQSEPYNKSGITTVPVNGLVKPARAGTADSAFSRVGSFPVPVSPAHGLGQNESSGDTLTGTPYRHIIPLARTLRHVYFGEYHGIPSLPPPDLVGGSDQERMGGSTQGAYPPSGDLGKYSSPSARRANLLKEHERKKISQGFGKGALIKASDREATAAVDDGVNVDNQRSVPGMWWTVSPEGPLLSDEDVSQLDGASSFPTGLPTGVPMVSQGWEEVEDAVYISGNHGDAIATARVNATEEEKTSYF